MPRGMPMPKSLRKIDFFDGPYFFLSNFYASEIEYEGRTYKTVEHAFQAAKALRIEHKIAVQEAAGPGQAKAMGQRVQLRPDWESVKYTVMLNCLRLKFAKDPLRSRLLETGEAELVEGNTWGDRVWGVVDGVGENHLGRLLMQVRRELQTEQA